MKFLSLFAGASSLCVFAAPTALAQDQTPNPAPPQQSACLRPYEDDVFKGTGDYAYLDDCDLPVTPTAILGQATPLLNSNQSPNPQPFNIIASGDFVGNNEQASWGEHGPLWFMRWYNALGVIGGFNVYRIGDYSQGREGHVFYMNVLEDVLIAGVNAYQCGAQFGQFVWRPSETQIDPSLWDQANHLVHIAYCGIYDQGVINQGTAVRASWPISFFNPGQDLLVEHVDLDVDFAPIYTGTGGPFNSHGAIVCTPGTIASTRTSHVDILNSTFKLKNPDRSLFRFWGVDNVNINNCAIDITSGSRSISLIQSNAVTETLEIKNTSTTHPITIKIFDESSPWGNPIQTFTYNGTSDFFWQG